MNRVTRKEYKELQLIDAEGHRKSASKHNMNRKADKKLSEIAEFFSNSIPECSLIQNDQLLCKTLEFTECEPLTKVYLAYDLENRFASISYNLLLQEFVPAEEAEAYQLVLKYEGLLVIKDVKFVDADNNTATGEGNPRTEEILSRLNDSIILSKIKELNPLQIVLQYNLSEKRWIISFKSILGSATWILIPPMMNLISFKRREAYLMMEVMRMLAASI